MSTSTNPTSIVFSSCRNCSISAIVQRHGVSIADTDANFQATREHVHYDLGLDFTIPNVTDVLRAGNAQGTEKYGTLNLSPNDQDTVLRLESEDRQQLYNSIRHRLMDDEASRKVRELIKRGSVVDLGNRIEAATVLGDNYSRDPHAKNQSFRSWLSSIYSTTDLEDRVRGVLENRRLRSLTTSQLRAEARGQQPQASSSPILPLAIDGEAIVKASAGQIRTWIKQYGQEQLNDRIREYKEANQALDAAMRRDAEYRRTHRGEE